MATSAKQESESKVNITIPENYSGNPIEVVLREGRASVPLDPKEPQIINISGVIYSPLNWLEKRLSLLDQKTCHILVSRNNIKIKLVINESSYYSSTITGSLETAQKFREFGINTTKEWEPAKLSQFFKMNRAFFSDKAENMSLVTELKHFRTKVNQDIERYVEENGSKTDNFVQIVDSNLPKSFKVCLPLFTGFPAQEIEVEIYAEVDGRTVSLSLVSPGAEELLEEFRNRIIDEQIEQIKQIAPAIVIIEE